METPSPYGHDEHMEKYRADREAREQAEHDRLAAALGKDWNPVRPADVRAWDVVPAPKFKKDYVGSFVRALDVPRNEYASVRDAVPDNAVMQIRTRNTGFGYSGSNKVVLNCDWHCPCCGHAHEKVLDESAIAEGKLQFLAPSKHSAGSCGEKYFFYLASPYSHPEHSVREQRWLEAARAAAWLMNNGHRVLSPISMGHPMAVWGAKGDWQAWQHVCLAMLAATKSLCILMIDGWEQSVGIRAELDHARKLGMTVWSLLPQNDGDYQFGVSTKMQRG